MRILMIGGTGTISMAISERLVKQGHEVYLLNRGKRKSAVHGATVIIGDINDEPGMKEKTAGMTFDMVADFIAFHPEQLERDYRLFGGRTKQFIFISSASAYQKPLNDYRITESTPLANPYWEYSRNKIACEEYLRKLYREEGFPITIIRPSHTYDERSVPLGLHGEHGSWQTVKRIMEGKKIIIPGDGTSLWTMTHSSDFAVGFTGLVGNVHAIGHEVQITTGESLTWNQIHEVIADELGVELKAVHVASEFLAAAGKQYDLQGSLIGDKSNTVVFDNEKLKRLVPEFRPAVSMSDGIRRTVRYVVGHEALHHEDAEFDQWSDRVIQVLEEAAEKLR